MTTIHIHRHMEATSTQETDGTPPSNDSTAALERGIDYLDAESNVFRPANVLRVTDTDGLWRAGRSIANVENRMAIGANSLSAARAWQ
jgi:hypothetical protein